MNKKEIEVVLQRIENWYARLPDLIVFDKQNFHAEFGDKIAFNDLAFPGLNNQESFTFAAAKKKKRMKALSKQDYDLVYYAKKGFLYYDGNDTNKNWGSQNEGGFFAKLDRGLDLTINDFIFYDL